MTSGYDERTVLKKHRSPQFGPLANPSGRLTFAGASEVSETVTSFRSNVKGKPVSEASVDPYGHFIKANMDFKRKSQLLRNEKATQAFNHTEYNGTVVPFVDTGHPFKMVRRTGKTSLYRTFTYNDRGSATLCDAASAYNGEVHALDQILLPFSIQGTVIGTAEYGRFEGVSKMALPSEGGIQEYGTRAIAALSPGRPNVDFLRALGEILVGFPDVPLSIFFPDNSKTGITRKGKRVKATAKEYLNYSFGLSPTVNDAVKIGKTLASLSERILQLQRDAGRIIRRDMEAPISIKEVKLPGDAAGRAQVMPGTEWCAVPSRTSTSARIGNLGTRTTTLTVREEVTRSFSGAFSYYLPVPTTFGGKVERYMAELDRVVGISLNPANIWELTPWSWLIDWVTDIGSMLDSAQVAFDDSLLINYGYAMQTTKRFVEQYTELQYNAGSSGPAYCRTSGLVEVKQRIRANPYGFLNLTSGDWNPFRWSILAALGLSRV